MTTAPAERRPGTLAQWNDERGFGFIAVDGQREKVFVHVSAFGPIERRPLQGDALTFITSIDERGRTSARDVVVAGVAKAATMPRTDAVIGRDGRARVRPQRWSPLDVVAVTALAIVLGAGIGLGVLPVWTLALYGGLSVAAALLYWSDKRNAETGGWRTPESTLHVIGLAGGWPGAIVAQRWLRHKTLKVGFRITFWGTVALNLIVLGLAGTPAGRAWLDALSG